MNMNIGIDWTGDSLTFEILHRNVEVLYEEGLMPLPHGDVYGDALGWEEEEGGPTGDAQPSPQLHIGVVAHRMPDIVPEDTVVSGQYKPQLSRKHQIQGSEVQIDKF